MSPSSHLWQVWPGRSWPASVSEEKLFVEVLTDRVTGRATSKWTRGDVTSLLNALRCGLTPDELFKAGPGLLPARLLAAYRHLEALRLESAAAWSAIVDQPDSARLAESGPVAARLVPTPIYRLVEVANERDQHAVDVLLERILSDMRKISNQVSVVEVDLADLGADKSDEAVALGCILYHPYQQGLWGHPYFIPGRVGALTPTRVATLLGEEPLL
jgi:uncharacterized protein (DUF433 family)